MNDPSAQAKHDSAGEPRSPGRRRLLVAGAAALGLAGIALVVRRRIVGRLSRWTELADFDAVQPAPVLDPTRDRRTVHVAQGGRPEENVERVLGAFGGLSKIVGKDDVVLVKMSAQWWNQGMTNVAAAKRLLEAILEVPGFAGEVIVFENTHFRLANGSGLSRAWTRPSERNVDVPGWTCLGDLIPHFAGRNAPVSFVGLVDAGRSDLAGDHWHDAGHEHGVYGGDGRGPIAPGEVRDGYRWDFAEAFRRKRSLVDHAQTPLTWPVFQSPRSGLWIDLKDGVQRREGDRLVSAGRKLTWINMTTANEHAATGITAACKSTMGVVDMSAGRLGTDPRVRDYQSVHYFGAPRATWRMAGPLAHFARRVRTPDLYVTVAEWVAATPRSSSRDWGEGDDIRLASESAFQTRTVVAGTDAVAIDAWCTKNLLMPIGGASKSELYDLDDERSKVVKFLRYYREVFGSGATDPAFIDVA